MNALPKKIPTAPANVSHASLFEYYQNTCQDCESLLGQIEQLTPSLNHFSGWAPAPSHAPGKKLELNLEQLSSVFADLLATHSERLVKSHTNLKKDEGYVPLLLSLLREEIAKESLRTKSLFAAFLQEKNKLPHSKPAMLNIALKIRTPPQSLDILSDEINHKMPLWQEDIIAYIANYPYCQLLLECGSTILKKDNKEIQSALRKFQSFKHPFHSVE